MPVTRRAFLATTAGLAAVAGAGANLTAGVEASASPAEGPGGLRWPPGQVFPTFGRARYLDAADVHGMHGDDVTLLTTLQGIVNRRRPSVYLSFDPVDGTWLADLGVPTTAHADPMDLVRRYRHAVRGAVLYDEDVPDTVNLATTLAGLTDSVVANAAQVREYGLHVTHDLRGRFKDDAVSVYSWQMEHLWPRCSHRMLAGLPPTQVVSVPGVEWTEVARETKEVRDSSNEADFTIDLSDALGGEAVYVRFGDSFGSDGWGASIDKLTLTADGSTVVTFTPEDGTEEKYLYDGEHSQVGGDGNRFADGGNYFIYRFEPPTGTTTLTITVHMWNEYVVSVTDQAPTAHEPFPNFRDFVVATRSMVSWLPPSGESGTLLKSIFGEVEAGTPYAGWFANDVSGEWDGVEIASNNGVEVVAADYYMNGTVLAGLPAPTYTRPRRPVRGKPAQKVYVTLTFGEGDNIQYCQRHMRDLWDDPARGSVPMNWTVSPLLKDIGPRLLHHYQQTATENDLLVCGPSGAGYTYPNSWDQNAFDTYAGLSGRYARATGMDVVYSYSSRNDANTAWTKLPPWVLESFAAHGRYRGIIQTDEKGTISDPDATIPLIGNLMPNGDPDDYLERIKGYVADQGSGRPVFIAVAVNAWSMTPSGLKTLVASMPGGYEVVLADEFFDLFGRS